MRVLGRSTGPSMDQPLHYPGLQLREMDRKGLYRYDCLSPTTIIGHHTARVYHLCPGDTYSTDQPLWVNNIPEPIIIERCSYCGTLQKKGNTHCPSCGGHY